MKRIRYRNHPKNPRGYSRHWRKLHHAGELGPNRKKIKPQLPESCGYSTNVFTI